MLTRALSFGLIGAAWLVGVACALWLIGADVMSARAQPGLSINGHAIWGRDFVNVWSAGQLVIEGQLDILYDVQAYRAWQESAFPGQLDLHNYSYPPLTLFYAPLFGALPYPLALLLWLALSLGAFAWAARPWLRDAGLAWGIAVLLPSTLVCLWAGHYGLIFGALWLGAWRLLDSRPATAGVLVGLMAVKPHLAVLMPLMLLIRRDWRAIGGAALTVGALVVASAVVFGPELWRTYLAQTSGDQIALVEASRAFFVKMMPTLTPALIANGVSVSTAWALQALLALATVAALIVFMPEGYEDAAMASAVATFLILPYGFNYDLTVVGLAAALAFHRALADRRYLTAAIAAATLILPAALIALNKKGVWVAPLILALFLAALLREARRGRS